MNRRPRSLLLVLLMMIVLQAGPSFASDESMAIIGKHAFRTYCTSCHGQQALGDGPVAKYLVVPPSDLTKISDRHDGEFPAERVFKIIDGREKVRGHGSSEMPVWGDAFQKTDAELTEDQVRDKVQSLVHYLESLQKP